MNVIKYEVIRDVTQHECGWLPEDIRRGTILFRFKGCTYGCIDDGVACSETGPLGLPFFEMPRNSLRTHQETS